jgi:hypothetical protein
MTSSNTHDIKAAAETLDSIIVIKRRPRPRKFRCQQHLCLDKGYDFLEIEREVFKRKYVCRTSAIGAREGRGREAPQKKKAMGRCRAYKFMA